MLLQELAVKVLPANKVASDVAALYRPTLLRVEADARKDALEENVAVNWAERLLAVAKVTVVRLVLAEISPSSVTWLALGLPM